MKMEENLIINIFVDREWSYTYSCSRLGSIHATHLSICTP